RASLLMVRVQRRRNQGRAGNPSLISPRSEDTCTRVSRGMNRSLWSISTPHPEHENHSCQDYCRKGCSSSKYVNKESSSVKREEKSREQRDNQKNDGNSSQPEGQ